MSELVVINTAIADRTYRIKVGKKDEEVVHRVSKLINEKIVEFKTHYAGKDMQDYISMALIWLATEETQANNALADIAALSQQISDMGTQIDAAML